MPYVKHYHILPPPYGGVSVYVKRLVLALCKKGLKSSAFKGTELVGLPADIIDTLDEFPKHSRSIFILPELVRLYKVFKPYKIIHTHTTLTACFGIWVIHVLQNKPIVYTIHNQMIEQEFSLLYFWDKLIFKALAASPTVQFTTVNVIAKEKLDSKGFFFKNEIKVITPYIPPVEYGNSIDYLSENLIEFIKKHPRFILFYAESFATHCGVDIYGTRTMLDAFIKVSKIDKDIALVYCITNMGGEYSKLTSLMSMAEEMGCADRIYWQIGAVHEMWPLLKDATLLVRPTTTDGDSVMIREALSFGLPVVTTNVTPRPEGCIVYTSGDLEMLINEILHVINQPYRRIYPQEDQTQMMLDIYQRLLEHNE